MSVPFFANFFKSKPQNTILVSDLPGTNKKSFALYFRGAEIWFEHLDGMYQFTEEVAKKFTDDIQKNFRPSAPSLISVILDETDVSEELIFLIIDTFIKNNRFIRKVAFTGLNRNSVKLMKRTLKLRWNEYSFIVNYENDLEKAKEWLVGKL